MELEITRNNPVSPLHSSENTQPVKVESPSFLDWWSPLEEAEQIAVKTTSPKTSIDRTPAIDYPGKELSPLSPVITKKKKGREIDIPLRKMEEIVSLLSEKTIKKVLEIVSKNQLEVEKENLIGSDTTFNSYEKFRKQKDQMLQEIRDTLLKDEIWADKIKSPVHIAGIASFICTLASLAISSGAIDFLEQGVSAIFGEPAKHFFKGTTKCLAALAPSLAALFVGGKALEAYSHLKIDDVTGKMVLTGYQEEFYNHSTDSAYERTEKIGETITFFQDYLANLEKRNQRLHQLILQK